MKVLSIIGLVLGALALIMGCYLQFSLVPAADIATSNIDHNIGMLGDAYYGSSQHTLDMAIQESKTRFGEMVLVAGLLAIVVSFLPAIKKRKMAWLGVALGVVSALIGAIHGTHMFS